MLSPILPPLLVWEGDKVEQRWVYMAGEIERGNVFQKKKTNKSE